MKTIHAIIREQTGMARFYAKNGAVRLAAKVLRDLADEMEAYVDCSEARFRDPVNLQGSGPAPITTRED